MSVRYEHSYYTVVRERDGCINYITRIMAMNNENIRCNVPYNMKFRYENISADQIMDKEWKLNNV